MNPAIVIAKLTTLLGWLLIIVNWLHPIDDWYNLLHWAGIFLIVAHSIEMLVFLPAARRAPGNTAIHALQLLVFGYAHNMALMEQAKAADQ